MTTQDLMKLADAYAETMYLRQDRYEARQLLLDALEELGREVAELKAGVALAVEQAETLIKQRDQARAELAAIRAQEPVGHFLKDFGQQGFWQQCKTEMQGMTIPLFATPAAKDAGMVADGYPCEIEEADFEANTVTLKMMTSNYQVSAGKYLLKEAPKIGVFDG